MTEFVNVGKHCELKDCNRQDYLPFKCNNCNRWFCIDHWGLDNHVCTIKSKIIITEKVEKIYTHNCSVKKCKINELIPIICPKCEKNYFFKHRLPTIHNC